MTFPSASYVSLPVSVATTSRHEGVFNITSLAVPEGLLVADVARGFDQALAQQSAVLDLKGVFRDTTEHNQCGCSSGYKKCGLFAVHVDIYDNKLDVAIKDWEGDSPKNDTF